MPELTLPAVMGLVVFCGVMGIILGEVMMWATRTGRYYDG